MRILLLLVLITWHQDCISTQRCSSPKVSSLRQVFIYRTSPTIKVKVVSCLYCDGNNTTEYYDISSNCIKASISGIFIDKYGGTHFVNPGDSIVTIEEYTAIADPLKNSILLRSGTKCRYDRGFCYDSKEDLNYAATWDVTPIPQESCPNHLEQIFFGYVDFWTFTNENRNYLFYSLPLTDKSFALSLSNSSVCHNKQVWNSEETGYIVSYTSLLPTITPTPISDEKLFPSLSSKARVSEAIITDCNLKVHTLDFDARVDDWVVISESSITVLKLYQQYIDNNEKAIVELARSIKKLENAPAGPSSNKPELNILKTSINTMLININYLFDKIKKLEVSDSAILLKIANLITNINKLENSVKLLETNNKNFEKDRQTLQKDLEQQFLNFNKNISEVIKVEINQLYSTTENSVVGKLSPLLDSVNQTSIVCLKAVKNLKQNTDKLIKKLEDEITKTALSVEKTIKVYVNNASVNIEDKINDKLIPIKSSLLKKCDNCSHEIVNLQNRASTSINIVEHALQQCTLKQKHIIDDINNVNTSIVKRLTFSENNLLYLTNLVDTHSRSSKTVKNATDLLLRDIINNITHTHHLLNTSVEINTVNKQRNIIFNSLNDKINQCSKTVSTLNNYIVQTASALKQETIQSGIDAYRNITNLNTVFSSQIDKTHSKIKGLENELKQFNTVTGFNKNITDLNFDRISQEISLLRHSTSDAVSKSEADIFKKVTPLLTPSLSNEQITKDLDTMYKSLTKEIESLKYQVKPLENNVGDFKRTTEIKTRANEDKIKDITKDLTNAHTTLSNLPKKIEDTVLNQIHLKLQTALSKSVECGNKNSGLESDIKWIKTELIRIENDDLANKAFHRFLPNYRLV